MKAVSVPPDPAIARMADRHVDWQYAACVAAPAGIDALGLARACFERAPLAMRGFLVVGWMLLLLEGRPRSDDSHVLGWPIRQIEPAAVLQRRSRLGLYATLVFAVRDGGLTFASMMSYTNPIVRPIWSCVAPIHRWAVRSVLTHAAASVIDSR